jgi:hypothetical protein
MKASKSRFISALAGIFIILSGALNGAVKLLDEAHVPGAHVVINSEGASTPEGMQVRFTNNNDYRAVSQSFQWNSNGELRGVGLRLFTGQGAFKATQNYMLAIYNAQSWKARSPVGAPVFAAEVELSGSLITAKAGGRFLYFDLADLKIPLVDGNSYVLVFGPDPKRAPVPGQRLAFHISIDCYANGVANQLSSLTLATVTDNRFNYELNFFLASSSPATTPAEAAGNVAQAPIKATVVGAEIDSDADNFVSLAPAQSADAQDVLLSIQGEPADVAMQTRYHHGADYRAATQSFRWTSPGELARVGLKLAKTQEPFKSAQRYIIRIYNAAGWSGRSEVTTPVFSRELTLTPALVNAAAAGKYLEFDLSRFHIKLVRGQSYLLVFGPDPASQPVGGQRLQIETSVNPYQTGVASQIPSLAIDSVPGTRLNLDLIIYLAASQGGLAKGKSALVEDIIEGPENTFFAYPHNNGFYNGEPVLAKYANGTQYFILFDPVSGRESILGSVTGLKRFQYYDIATTGLAVVGVDAGVALVDLTGILPNRILYKAPAGCKLHMPSISPDGGTVAVALEKTAKDGGSDDHQLVSIDVESKKAATLLTKPFLINHVQFSPHDPAWIMFSHEGSASQVKDRIWAWNAGEAPGGKTLFSPQTGANGRALLVGHERPLHHKPGQIFCVYAGSGGRPVGLYEVDFAGNSRVISEGDAWHCDISKDGKWAVLDTQGDGASGDLVAVNCKTGARMPLVDKIAYAQHPYHPHPRISDDGKWVIYNDAAAQKAVFVKISQRELEKFIP